MSETEFETQADQKQMIVTRKFNGPLETVWKAWTESDLLDQWWAPQPWKAVTKYMDFREGGHWLYCMVGPEGEQHWGRADYKKIIMHDRFEVEDSFCDEEGNKNSDLPGMRWNVMFKAAGSGTEIQAVITFPSQEDMEKIMEMGFREGFTQAHQHLDDLLIRL